MKEINNEYLGNFGFLLCFNQDFLFELAQFAESNLYLNKRMCAVFIRQLTESFFETVIELEKIEVKPLNNDKKYPESSIQGKENVIVEYYNYGVGKRRKYGEKTFPRKSDMSKVRYPGGERSNKIYVWDFIRKLGNVGSHPVLSDSNLMWLEEKYLITALKELCNRMRIFFYGFNNKNNPASYNVERQSLASREVFFTNEGLKSKENNFNGALPNYDEKRYYTVVSKLGESQGKSRWENYVNRHSIIRKYEKANISGIQQYLLHSQKAYLRLQQIRDHIGFAKYSVLADLRNSENYYVTSYEFDVEPQDININSLRECKFYNDKRSFINIILQFVKSMQFITEARIYHRALTHNSIKLCLYDNGEVVVKIIDFELVKLFEDNNEYQAETVYLGVNNQMQMLETMQKEKNSCLLNVGQYGKKEWAVDASEDEYLHEQERRTGMIISNMLCASHFDNTREFEKYSSMEEIIGHDNLKQYAFDNNIIYQTAEIAQELIRNDITIIEALAKLEVVNIDVDG